MQFLIVDPLSVRVSSFLKYFEVLDTWTNLSKERQKHARSREACMHVCVDGSCLLIKGAVWSQTGHLDSQDPALTQRGHLIHGRDTQLILDIQTQQPGLIWSDTSLVLIGRESMKEVVHQPPFDTWRARGIVLENLNTGFRQCIRRLSGSMVTLVFSSKHRCAAELLAWLSTLNLVSPSKF